MAITSAPGTLPFSALFRRSFDFLKTHMRTVLLLAVLVAVITAVTQLLAVAMPQKAVMVNGQPTVEMETDWAQASPVMIAAFVLIQIIAGLTGISVHIAMWMLAARGSGDAGTLLRKSVGLILPMFGLYFWIFIRSYVWIAFIGAVFLFIAAMTQQIPFAVIGGILVLAGCVCSIIFSPRFAATQLLYLRDGMPVRQAVDQSYLRTNGYWGKVVGNMFLATLCMIPLSIAMSVITALVASLSLGGFQSSPVAVASAVLVLGAISALIQGFLGAFMIFFGKELAATILENPRAA